MSQTSGGYRWWQASDGLWYPPETHPDYRPILPPPMAAPMGYFAVDRQTGLPVFPNVTPRRTTNGLAIASLVCGIVQVGCLFTGVSSILAVIFGFIALREIKGRDQDGRGMAIAGVVLGTIGIVLAVAFIVIVVLASNNAPTTQH